LFVLSFIYKILCSPSFYTNGRIIFFLAVVGGFKMAGWVLSYLVAKADG
jgi:hypothetical protein